MAALGVSFHLLIEDQGLVLSAISVPFDSNWFMLRPWAMSFFEKLCPAPFAPVITLHSVDFCLLKKDTQCESCQLSFTWGKMRTAAWETLPQIALRGPLWRGSGGRSVYMILVKGELSAVKHLTFKRFSASQEELMSPWKNLVLF